MSFSQSIFAPIAESVLHPTDFSVESEKAFLHALITAREISFDHNVKLTLLHVGAEYPAENDWMKFPPVRATLEKWGILAKGAPRSAVFEQLKIGVTKVNLPGDDPLPAILEYLDHNQTDLIVLATQGRTGLPRWLRPSFAERLAQRSKTMTLFVPKDAKGFVSPKDGRISLRRILVPVDFEPCPQAAVEYAFHGATMTDETGVEVIILHVGDPAESPAIDFPNVAHCSWNKIVRQGDVTDEIIRAAMEFDVDLISMATQGHEGILDALRGSVTEQVLRQAPCPLLAVPALRECFYGAYRFIAGDSQQASVRHPFTPRVVEKAYRIIGVSPEHSWEEIKRAHKNKLAKCHPDKVSHLSEELQERAVELTLELNNAFSVLKQEREQRESLP